MILDVNLAKNQLPRRFSSELKLTTLAQKASIHAMYVWGTINEQLVFLYQQFVSLPTVLCPPVNDPTRNVSPHPL